MPKPNSAYFAQTTITAVVYLRDEGKTAFKGYFIANGDDNSVKKPTAVFATREEFEQRLEAE
jgi:hypothetical protein